MCVRIMIIKKSFNKTILYINPKLHHIYETETLHCTQTLVSVCSHSGQKWFWSSIHEIEILHFPKITLLICFWPFGVHFPQKKERLNLCWSLNAQIRHMSVKRIMSRELVTAECLAVLWEPCNKWDIYVPPRAMEIFFQCWSLHSKSYL